MSISRLARSTGPVTPKAMASSAVQNTPRLSCAQSRCGVCRSNDHIQRIRDSKICKNPINVLSKCRRHHVLQPADRNRWSSSASQYFQNLQNFFELAEAIEKRSERAKSPKHAFRATGGGGGLSDSSVKMVRSTRRPAAEASATANFSTASQYPRRLITAADIVLRST